MEVGENFIFKKMKTKNDIPSGSRVGKAHWSPSELGSNGSRLLSVYPWESSVLEAQLSFLQNGDHNG